ncbi:hypothetical protein [Amycolatopsis sp. lyj-90]|uniref:hypothetical protein n=1 Tax=Amycolatopsis sp. lyj-90 TaxID=2789285 RepID=UPI00397AD149
MTNVTEGSRHRAPELNAWCTGATHRYANRQDLLNPLVDTLHMIHDDAQILLAIS